MSTRFEDARKLARNAAMAFAARSGKSAAALALGACSLAVVGAGRDAALAQPTEPARSEARRERLVNRTVLGVGTDAYTAWDASMMLCAWNAIGGENVRAETPWLTRGPARAKGVVSDPDALPADARRLLFLALVWGESRKLNLFVPQEKDLESAVATIRDAGCSVEGGGPEAAAFVRTLPAERWRFYADVALRAKGFERVRGGLERNRALLGQSWFWHTEDAGG